MSRQVLSDQASATRTFAELVKAHAAVTRRLNAQLTTDHGLTLNDYEVLLHLSRAPDRRLRRVDLVDRVLLTASGVTRLLEGLEKSGLVERAACDSDRRVVYAALTPAGLEKLRAAAKTHLPQIDAFLAQRLNVDELEALTRLLTRLGQGTGDGEDCSPEP